MDTTRRGAGINNLRAARAPYLPVLWLRHGPPADYRNRPYRHQRI